ncbi:MAG: acyl carrier protein [Myxococcales bacterium FL481]|nr:MAG: acyl carrier protein [Myxococcales bacterium FL481]
MARTPCRARRRHYTTEEHGRGGTLSDARQAIRSELIRYLRDEVLHDPDETLDPSTPLLTSGLLDSFNLVQLVMFVEDRFAVRLDDAEFEHARVDTVEQLTQCIVGTDG